MAMRVTGMMSGMDTESIIQELVAVRQTKVDDVKKEQTKLEWKQDAWKELNTKIKKLYTGSLSALRYQSAYNKKATKVSNSNLVDVVTGDSAMNTVQSLQINKLAKSGYLTGGKISTADNEKCTSGTLVTDLGVTEGSCFNISAGNKSVDIIIDEKTTINDVITKLQEAGVNANFDAKNQRIFIGSKESGAEGNFTITAVNSDGLNAMDKLGILTYGSGGEDDKVLEAYKKWAELSADDRTKAIDEKAAALLKTYTAERDSLVKDVEALNKKQDTLIEAFKKEFADSTIFDDVTGEDFATKLGDRIDALKTAQTDAQAILDDETASAEAKEAAQEALNKAKSELSYLEGYQTNAKSIADKQARIDVLNTDYIAEDGTAGAKTIADATAYIDGKIAQSKDVVDHYAANKAAYEQRPADERAVKTDGQDAEIVLNGATFTSNSNTFEINGLTITCRGTTAAGETVTLTTENDTGGIYDMVKKFITEYSTLINEMDKLYNADSAKDYDPLTDEEKDSMSETEVEKWETKIKDSLLRRDSNLNTIASAFKEIMASGYEVNGKTMYLSDFGIETLGYFEAADNEKNAYHISGDEDDSMVSSDENKLLAMISSDPDAVTSFFSQLSKSLYGKCSELSSKQKDYRSYGSFYDDLKMTSDYDDYKSKIAEMEEDLQDYENRWYDKFSAMETAMAKMQSNANAISGLLGG